MRYLSICFILSLIVTNSSTLFAQNLPEWLMPSRDGRDFYVQGKMHLSADSSITEGEVEVKRFAEDTLLFKFRTDGGLFEFFLHKDMNYLVTFKHKFTDHKPILFDTHGPEEKAWRKGFALLLDIYMERLPDNFSRSLLNEPFGKVVYNDKTRLFEPDQEYSSNQMFRWDIEKQRVSQ